MVAHACNCSATFDWRFGGNWWRLGFGAIYLYVVLGPLTPDGGILVQFFTTK
jgi:hypothetical protein